ncbi:MAG: succinyl-diaminopimelate desuccinylase [Egibacteraceae bacterium]
MSTTSRPELTQLLLDLLALPCVTGEEGPIADWLIARYHDEPVLRVGQSVVVGHSRGDRPTVLLVGHLDVVPPTAHDRLPRRDGQRIVGRGASDMKAGLAVAMSCFDDPRLRAGPYALLLVAYAGEEGPHEANELGAVLAADPRLRAAALAIVLEPTDLTVQLGCLGALHARVTFSGRSAHSARPWEGENALTKAGRFLAELHELPPRDVIVDGLVYREVLSATRASTGGNARNVVPDRFTINLNFRFAPNRTLEQAEDRVVELVGGAAAVEVVDRAPPCPPSRDAPLVARFLDVVGAPVEAKQAWTDVARLSAAGIPALNYGPGLTAQAHQAGEYVPEGNLVVARSAIGRFLADGGKVRQKRHREVPHE